MVRGDNCKLSCCLPKARQTKSRTATSSEFSWNFVPLNIVKPYISIKMNKRGKKISRQFYIDKFRKPGTTWAQNIERSEPKHSKIVIKRHQILISLCGIGKQLFNVTSALRCIGQYLQNSLFFHKSTTLIFGSCFERNKKASTQGYGKLVSEISRNEAQK